MSLRTKLTVGLGFLFAIILGLAFYSSFEIQGLSKDAERILRDNYDSLVYCKNMLVALDDMRTAISSRVFGQNLNRPSDYYSHFFDAGKSTFESNLTAEKNNITEIHERDYVEDLNSNYSLFSNLCLQILGKGGSPSLYFNDFLPAYTNVRRAIVDVNDVNMQAIERKNKLTKHNAGNMIEAMAAIGAACILLAFFYFWYFPFYISNTTSYLAKRMKELLEKNGMKLESKSKDEAVLLLHAINLLENKLTKRRGKS